MSDPIVPKGERSPGTRPIITVERRGSGHKAPQEPAPEVTFLDIWRILRRRRGFITASIVSVFALAIVYTVTSTPKYESTSTIEFNLENADVVSAKDGQSLTTDPNVLIYQVTQESQVKALQSDSLALRVAKELNLQSRQEFTRESLPDSFRKFPDESKLPLDDAPHRRFKVLRAFHKNLSVKAVAGSRMIQISFLSPDPQLAPKIVNALVNDFQDQQFRIRYAATAQVSDWLTEQLDGLKKQVETSQEKLVEYQKKAGILGTDETHNIIMTRLEEVDQRLVAAQSNRILAQTVWQLAQSGNPELISSLGSIPAVGAASPNSPNIMALIGNLRLQQSQLKAQYAQASSKYGSAYPALIQMKHQIDQMDETIDGEIQNLGRRARNDYLAAKQTEEELRQSFDVAKAEANKLNDDALQYTIFKHEVDSNRNLYDTLSTQLREAGILANLRPTNVVLIDPGSASDRPAKPSLPINLAGGLLMGLLLGVGGAFVIENMDETVTSPDQAEQLTLLPSIGVVPRSKQLSGKLDAGKLQSISTPSPQILVANRPHSRVGEAYRALRTSIMQVSRRGECNVLLFTSALPEEGKTTTSLNCAAALAQQGAKVLLVEADMRRANLTSQLGLTGSTGLSSLLSDGHIDGLPLQLGCIPNLSIIPAGPRPQYPADLLGSPRMADLIETWRLDHDYIVIDTPPALTVTDAVVASAYCDAVVLVARSRVTKKQSLLRARDLFRRSQKRILGVVMNAFDLNSADHAHYFGYEPSAKNGRGYYISAAN